MTDDFLDKYLNPPPATRVPADAGEWADGLRAILDRIPDGWGRWLDIGRGWYPLVIETDQKLAALDPAYEVHQVKEKFGCYDAETEVLTEAGWRHFQDVAVGDSVASLSSDGFLIYEHATDVIAFPYVGKMYRLLSRGVDLLVTPQHNLFVGKASYYNGRVRGAVVRRDYAPRLRTPDEMWKQRKAFLKGADWGGSDIKTFVLPSETRRRPLSANGTRLGIRTYMNPDREFAMDSWLEMLGWFVAEGTTGVGDKATGVTFSLDGTDGGAEAAAVGDILDRLGIAHTDRTFGSSTQIRFYDAHIGRWLRSACGGIAPTKRVPDFVRELSPRQIRLFLSALFAGDGHKSATAHILTTTSPDVADTVMELIVKAGDTFRYWKRSPRGKSGPASRIQGKHWVYEVNWLTNSLLHTTPATAMEEWVEYDGMVYCVTVPSHLLFVRRGGKGVWCGNSLRYYHQFVTEGADNEAGWKIESDAEAKSYTICEVCGTTDDVTSGGTGWITTRCGSCRDKPTQLGQF